MSAKEIKQAYKLGIKVTQLDQYRYEFKARVPDGPWWGTRWAGVINLDTDICWIDSAPRHPHVYKSKLCFHNNDLTLMSWIQALHTVWHQTTWEDTWKLDKCVEEMIEGLERKGEPDLLAEFRWIKRALKELNSSDDRIPQYRDLIADLKL